MADLQGVVFDKDGTLFDFHATWGNWTARLTEVLAQGDAALGAQMADALGYDRDSGSFRKDSIVIASTPPEIAAHLLPFLPGRDLGGLVMQMNRLAADAPQAEAVPLRPLLRGLRTRGLRLGVATNDAETPARTHLEAAGVEDCFDFIAGSDSGWGGKPAAGQLLAFASAFGLRPDAVVMVGDSLHDLVAGRAAGMRTVAVLTGIAGTADLAPFADAVLPDIGHLPDWIAAQAGAGPV
ncbi:HAD family hydrolase [Halodurantibacterium flavum]|uniref:phosphoglycolate phosphatase n=1 Tax=Halodurantibacterium flavum TaxID=1382802 RepID=A0ABW4S4E1_9RHOB